MDEYGSRRYIDKSCHTDDEEIKKRYLQFVEEMEPKHQATGIRIAEEISRVPCHDKLDAKRYADARSKMAGGSRDLSDDENVPMETEVTKRVNEYDKISGRMTSKFRGKESPLRQAAIPGGRPRDPAGSVGTPARARAWLIAKRSRRSFDNSMPLRQKIRATRILRITGHISGRRTSDSITRRKIACDSPMRSRRPAFRWSRSWIDQRKRI